jgi:hypothetical protein
MNGWNQHQEENQSALEKYTPRNLTDQKDFSKELREIEHNQTLSMLDKYKARKQLMRAVFQAKQQEVAHHLESFENYLLARKDVEAKSITLEAQRAIMTLEQEQLNMMKEMGLSHSEEISSTLIDAGNKLTEKLQEVEESSMKPEIKQQTMKNVWSVWEKTNKRIMDSVDTYIDELYEKEKRKL